MTQPAQLASGSGLGRPSGELPRPMSSGGVSSSGSGSSQSNANERGTSLSPLPPVSAWPADGTAAGGRSRFAAMPRPGPNQAAVPAASAPAAATSAPPAAPARAAGTKPAGAVTRHFQRSASKSAGSKDLTAAAAAAVGKAERGPVADLLAVERSATSLPAASTSWQPLTSPFSSAASHDTKAGGTARPPVVKRLKTRSALIVPELFGAAANGRNEQLTSLRTRSVKDAAVTATAV